MPTVFIPPPLKALAGGAERVTVEAATVRAAVDELEAQFPGMRDRLCVDDRIRPGWAVAVDGHVASLGLLKKLSADSEVHFLPAIGGG
jgi:sulfur-carrier protein